MADIQGRGVLPKDEEKKVTEKQIDIVQSNEMLVMIRFLAAINQQLKEIKDILQPSKAPVEEPKAEEPK
jgi:hypothetical protein